ncbi:MAG TPA: serine/threonine-protein kinase [Hyalangium sp.]|jgi:serine/threonine protein kinase|nr:serine/threonine-protein kinase [Hyalangium sp.]
MHEDLPPLGSTVGPWLILERLDSGSFGVVYRARRAGHPDSPPVVVKMARRPRDPRFEREAELLRLGIPGAPRFEGEGVWTAPSGERYPYVVMEWVEGFTLYSWFQGSRTSREVLVVLAQVAGALASAHAQGAVHRDVKGDNIRVEPQGRAVLVDWGSGWFVGARPLTDTTAPPGTTPYRPPEQRVFSYRFRKDLGARWQAKPTDDLYSLGVAFYRCVTGLYLTPLSEGGEIASSREVVPPSAYATVSLELETLILRLLSNEREARGTAEQLAREAMALTEQAGDAADRPIIPTKSAEPTDPGEPSSDRLDDEEVHSDTDRPTEPSSSTDSTRVHRRRRRQAVVPAWAAPTLAALASGFLVVLVMIVSTLLSRTRAPEPHWEEPPQDVAQFAPDAGVGEEALSTVEDLPRTTPPAMTALARPMPQKAFPGQKKPPCEPGYEIAALGACWAVFEKKPPCGSGGYELDGLCVRAVFPAPRQPTSNQP